MHRRLALALALALVPPAISACGGGGGLGEVTAIPADHLQIVAEGRVLATATVDQIAAGERARVEERGHDFAGVRLRDVLQGAGVDLAGLRGVEALAVDGYRFTLTRDLALADTTLVADREGDQALAGHVGPLRLVVAGDRAASVRALRRLVVNP